MNTLLMVGGESKRSELDGALRSRGFAPETAIGTEELANFEPDETCAVVGDLAEGRTDAFRLMYRLRRALPRMPIVAVAPFLDAVVEQHAARCGATFVLAEPLDPEELATCLDRHTGAAGSPTLS